MPLGDTQEPGRFCGRQGQAFRIRRVRCIAHTFIFTVRNRRSKGAGCEWAVSNLGEDWEQRLLRFPADAVTSSVAEKVNAGNLVQLSNRFVAPLKLLLGKGVVD